MASDDDFENVSESEDDIAGVWADESDEKIVPLSREGKNVGKSLRKVHFAEDENGQVIKKARVFDESSQLPLGARQKVTFPKSESDEDYENDEVLDEDSADDDGEDEDSLVVVKTSTSVKPSHVRNQRKNEAEIVGVRIRLQGLVNLMLKMPNDRPPRTTTSGLREAIISLLNVRSRILDNGSFVIGDNSRQDVDESASINDIWNSVHRTEESLWEQHRQTIDVWERRAHLATSKGKALRAMNKSAMEQTDAVLARRAETGNKPGDVLREDAEFYQQLLRDFVQARSAEAAPGIKDKVKLKRKQYLEKQVNREPQVNYEVHEKMINFLNPTAIPAPTVDLDQLIMSLFKS